MNKSPPLTLADVAKNQLVTIASLNFSIVAQQRFSNMGIVVGDKLAVVRPSVANSPCMVRVNGAYFMIRMQDARHIEVSTL